MFFKLLIIADSRDISEKAEVQLFAARAHGPGLPAPVWSMSFFAAPSEQVTTKASTPSHRQSSFSSLPL
jgi:hypothetical protein